MIRFILKTIEDVPIFRTVDVSKNNFAELNSALLDTKNHYEIVGIEHKISADELRCDAVSGLRIDCGFTSENRIAPEHRNTIPASNLVGGVIHVEPQFPEKYTPVLARDHDDSAWVAVVFIAKHAGSFETGNEHFGKMTLLRGNEHLVDTKSTPKFYWIPNKNEPTLIKS